MSKKLGVRAGQQVVLLGAPERVAAGVEGELAEVGEVKVSRSIRRTPGIPPEPVDTVMLFVDRLVDLEDRIGPATERLHPDGQIWVAWRSRRAADVREEVVRRIGLAAGMIDTKMCAIDRVWSGMRLVIRRENRDALAYRTAAGTGTPGTQRRRTRRATRPPQFSSGAGSGLATARARRRS